MSHAEKWTQKCKIHEWSVSRHVQKGCKIEDTKAIGVGGEVNQSRTSSFKAMNDDQTAAVLVKGGLVRQGHVAFGAG